MFKKSSKYNLPYLKKGSFSKHLLTYLLFVVSLVSASSVYTDTSSRTDEMNQPKNGIKPEIQPVVSDAKPVEESIQSSPVSTESMTESHAEEAKTSAKTTDQSAKPAQEENKPGDLIANPSPQEEDKFDELLKKSQQHENELATKMSEEEKNKIELAKKALLEEGKNVELVKKMIKEVTLKKRAEKIGSYYSKDFILYSNGTEIKFKDFKSKYDEIYKNPIEYVIKEPHTKIFAKNDKVTAHLLVTIKKPNVKPKELEVILIAQIKDGKIFRIWELVYPDWQRIIQ